MGAKCYEYVLSDKDVTIELWAAPSVNLPNWFIQNRDVLEGHIMEYTITSKDGRMESETIAINDHISKIGLTHKFNKLFKKKDVDKIIFFMKFDKKNNSNKINLILIKDFGKIKTNFQINSSKLKDFLIEELNK